MTCECGKRGIHTCSRYKTYTDPKIEKMTLSDKILDNGTYEVVGSGSGLDKGDIRVPSIDLVIEAKDQKQPQVASWVKQSDREGLGYSKTALMWRHPDSPSSNPDIRVDMSID